MVFQGPRDASAGQALIGSVLVHTSKPLRAEYLRIRLVAKRMTATPLWRGPSGAHRPTTLESAIFASVQPVSAACGEDISLPAGRYEYPIEVPLAGDLAETVEGLPEMELKYHLEVTVHGQKRRHILRARKRLRIIRTVGVDSSELFQARTAEGSTQDNKVAYFIGISQAAARFGGAIQVNVVVTTHVAGLQLEKINLRVTEDREVRVKASGARKARKPHKRTIVERRIAGRSCREWTYSTVDITDNTSASWATQLPLTLPKSLKDCAQDLDLDDIRVSHALCIDLALRTLDGRRTEVGKTAPVRPLSSINTDSQSKLHISMPVIIVMPSNAVFCEAGILLSRGEERAHDVQPLPRYSRHVHDKLISRYESGEAVAERTG